MIPYVITSHAHLQGVRLSKPGHWGNIPHPSEEAARTAAQADARGNRIVIRTKSFPALPEYRGRGAPFDSAREESNVYHYLVTDKSTGKKHLAEASSPSVAIAAAAAEVFTAERVDGGVLEHLKESLPLKRVAKETAPAAAAAAEPKGE